ncbi:MAG: hypothetical protein NC429_11925 [Lachnospiraceae bacterium]|nr:hypothetical protein [Lachnospiraceae bacterium]
MFDIISKWLDDVLKIDIPNEVIAFGFNLYDDGDYNWSMESAGTSEFDIDDEDWVCNEITDFNTVGFVDGDVEILYAKNI